MPEYHCAYCDMPRGYCDCVKNRRVSYELLRCKVSSIVELFDRYHPYGGSGGNGAVTAFAVIEDDSPVAGFIWRVPPLFAARAVSPSNHRGALALSRMVAVPKPNRRLKHISKPLRAQMSILQSRGRWPVLVTYSDASKGHNGFVYSCSGWTRDGTRSADYFEDEDGIRFSSYNNGETITQESSGQTELTRWVCRVCESGHEDEYMRNHGWSAALIGGQWKTGTPKRKVIREPLTLFGELG